MKRRTTMKAALFVSVLMMLILVGSVPRVTGQDARASVRGLSVLSGRVLDRNGPVVVGAEILLRQDKVARLVAVTNDQGIYRVDLPAGFYELQIRADGFSSFNLECYQIPTDGRVNLDVTLPVSDEAACDFRPGADNKTRAKKRKTIIID